MDIDSIIVRLKDNTDFKIDVKDFNTQEVLAMLKHKDQELVLPDRVDIPEDLYTDFCKCLLNDEPFIAMKVETFNIILYFKLDQAKEHIYIEESKNFLNVEEFINIIKMSCSYKEILDTKVYRIQYKKCMISFNINRYNNISLSIYGEVIL